MPDAQGARPLIFIAQHGGLAVRIAYIPGDTPTGKSASAPRQGIQMRTEKKLPIVGMATHPSRAHPSLRLAQPLSADLPISPVSTAVSICQYACQCACNTLECKLAVFLFVPSGGLCDHE